VDPDPGLRLFLSRIAAQFSDDVVQVENGTLLAAVAAGAVGNARNQVVVYNTDAGWDAIVAFHRQWPETPIIVLLSPSAGVNTDAAAMIEPAATLNIPFRNTLLKEAIVKAISAAVETSHAALAR
jgi:hypothetical protein